MDSYETILGRMNDNFRELSGFSADDASDIGIRLKVLAGEIFSLGTNLEWLKRQMFVQTASGEQLNLHAKQRGLERKQALKSEGTLTFSVTTALGYDVEIPLGTVCGISGVDEIRFETTESAVLASGDTTVTVNAKSVNGGLDKNVAANTITVMVTPPVGIASVTNSEEFLGGADSETDDSLKNRVIESYKNISNGTNSAFYRDEILKFDGVQSVSVVPLVRGPGTVDIYVAEKGAAASAELISEIQSYIDSIREINVDVEIKAPTLVEVFTPVSIKIEPGYIFTEVQQACLDVIDEYYDSLSIGEQVIFAAIGNAIFHVDGVKNYSFGSTIDFDKTIDEDELAVLGIVSVTRSD